jgi:hypothetical protein
MVVIEKACQIFLAENAETAEEIYSTFSEFYVFCESLKCNTFGTND